MRHPFVAVALAAAVLRLGCGPAVSHDIWLRAKEFNRPTGFPCCGGDPVTGDCEGLLDDQIWDQPNGDVIIFSRRYQARITIPASRIMVDVPRATEGEDKGQPLDKLTQFSAHYCGKPRGSPPLGYAIGPDDPDPNFHLFCFWRNGGGS